MVHKFSYHHVTNFSSQAQISLDKSCMLKSQHVILFTIRSEHGSQKHVDNAILSKSSQRLCIPLA